MSGETKMGKLSPAELYIVRSMLRKQYGPRSPFLQQLAVTGVENRRTTGVGIFVDLLFTGKPACVDQVNTEISEGYRTRLEPPCDRVGFTLFIRKGYLNFLESYTFGDVKWPDTPMEVWLLYNEIEAHSENGPTHGIKPDPIAAPIRTGAERPKLEAQLREQLRQDCDEAGRIGYKPTLFLSMMSKHGPVEACRQVIMASKIPDGFLRLLELNRLDLTAEATVLRGPWHALFSRAVLEQARRRLNACGREDLATRRE